MSKQNGIKWFINQTGFNTEVSGIFTTVERRMFLLLLMAKLNGEF